MNFKKKFRLITLLIILILNVSLIAQSAQDENDFKLSGLTQQKLENGLEIFVQENHRQQLVAIEVIVRTGSVFEGLLQGTGLAHLVEHMIFKGTSSRNASQIEEQIKDLGGQVNGYTSHQLTGFTLAVPSENFEKAFEIFVDMLKNPAFDEKELEKEKGVILSEIRMNNDDPQRYLQTIFFEKAYSIAPYNLPVIGIEPLFKDLSKADVMNFYRQWYLPNNMIISIAGDIESKDVFMYINELFKDFKMKPFPVVSLPDIPALRGMLNIEEEFRDINVAQMIIGFPSVTLTHPDSVTLDIIAAVLGQGNSSRLYQELVNKKKLFYSVDAYNYTPGFNGYFLIEGILDPANKDLIIDEVIGQIGILKSKLISEEELEKAKNAYINEYIFSQESVNSQAKSLASDVAYTNNPSFSREYLTAVSRLKPKDIKDCARRYFSKENFVSVILKPEEPDLLSKQDLETVVEPFKKITLKNGIRLLVKENHSLPIVSLHVCLDGGVRYENEAANGIFNLMRKMLTKGTKKRTAEKIAFEVELLGAQLTAFSGYNSFGLSLNFLKKDIWPMMDILSDILLNSAFPDEEIELIRRLTLKQIELERDNVFSDTLNVLRYNLFKSFPYRFNPLGTASSVAAISREQLLNCYSEFLDPQKMVISVCGDVNAEELKVFFEKKLGALKPKKQKSFLTFNEPKKEKQLIVNNLRNKEQAILMIGFPGCSVMSEDRRVLEFLNSFLSSPGSVLYEHIRENLGLSYTLGGGAVSGLDSGYFFIYVATTPEYVDEVKRILIEDINKIKLAEIDENKIQITRNYLLGAYRFGLETNSALSFVSGVDELYGLGAEYYLQYEGYINSITAEKLQDAARKYLDFDKSVIVLTTEEPND